MSEHQNQAALFDLLRANENRYPFLKFIFAIPNGGQRHIAVATKLKREGVKKGVFDVFVPIPQLNKFSYGLFIEMKFGENKLTPEQEKFQEFARESGYQTATCFSVDEAIAVIEGYLNIKLCK